VQWMEVGRASPGSVLAEQRSRLGINSFRPLPYYVVADLLGCY
jgi:hypothetical protein